VGVLDHTCRKRGRSAFATVQRKKGAEGVRTNERAIATEDKRIRIRSAVLKTRLRHHHGMTRAELLILKGELDIGCPCELSAQKLSSVPDDENDLRGTRRTCRVDHPVHHGSPHHGVHDLRKIRLHARALASGKDDGNKSAVRTGWMILHLGARAPSPQT
jgi:hypothetical protein